MEGTLKWVVEPEEMFQLKLPITYTKGRPSQNVLSEEDVLLIHRWQRSLEEALKGLGAEVISSFIE